MRDGNSVVKTNDGRWVLTMDERTACVVRAHLYHTTSIMDMKLLVRAGLMEAGAANEGCTDDESPWDDDGDDTELEDAGYGDMENTDAFSFCDLLPNFPGDKGGD